MGKWQAQTVSYKDPKRAFQLDMFMKYVLGFEDLENSYSSKACRIEVGEVPLWLHSLFTP